MTDPKKLIDRLLLASKSRRRVDQADTIANIARAALSDKGGA